MILPDVPMGHYVRDTFPGDTVSLSSSIAHRLLTRSPLHAWTAHPRLNPAWEPDDARAFDLGTAAHGVLLEGRSLFTVDFPDYRTKQAQAIRDTAKEAGQLPVLAHQAAAIREMVMIARLALANCPDLAGLLGCEHIETTILWTEGAAHLRCRPDMMTAGHEVIVSYKTTQANAEPNAFLRILLGSGYDVQAAFELAAVKAAVGKDARYVWLVQECEPPYACSLLGMSPMLYDLAHRKYLRAAALWSECMASGRWPAYPERICYLDPPAWSVTQFAEAHMYADNTVEAL